MNVPPRTASAIVAMAKSSASGMPIGTICVHRLSTQKFAKLLVAEGGEIDRRAVPDLADRRRGPQFGQRRHKARSDRDRGSASNRRANAIAWSARGPLTVERDVRPIEKEVGIGSAGLQCRVGQPEFRPRIGGVGHQGASPLRRFGLGDDLVQQPAAGSIVDRAPVVGIDQAEVPDLGALVDVGTPGAVSLSNCWARPFQAPAAAIRVWNAAKSSRKRRFAADNTPRMKRCVASS